MAPRGRATQSLVWMMEAGISYITRFVIRPFVSSDDSCACESPDVLRRIHHTCSYCREHGQGVLYLGSTCC